MESKIWKNEEFIKASKAFRVLLNNFALKRGIEILHDENEGDWWLIILKDDTKIIAEKLSVDTTKNKVGVSGFWTDLDKKNGLMAGSDILIPFSKIKEVHNPFEYKW